MNFDYHYLSEDEQECIEDIFFAAETGNIILLTNTLARIPKKKHAFYLNTSWNYQWDALTPLMVAARHEHLLIIDTLCHHNADIDLITGAESYKHGSSALFEAIYYDKEKSAARLLENGANPNLILSAFSGYKKSVTTPLLQAAYYDNAAIISELIKHGADIHMANECGYTPLLASGRSLVKKQECISILIEAGADIQNKTLEGDNIVSLAIDSTVNADYLRYLFEKGATLTQNGMERVSSLLYKDKLNTEALTVLINNGFNINFIDKNGNTILSKALKDFEKNSHAIQQLVHLGADVNLQTETNSSAFACLVSSRQRFNETLTLELCELFLKNGGNLAITNKDQKSISDLSLSYRGSDFMQKLHSLENNLLLNSVIQRENDEVEYRIQF